MDSFQFLKNLLLFAVIFVQVVAIATKELRGAENDDKDACLVSREKVCVAIATMPKPSIKSSFVTWDNAIIPYEFSTELNDDEKKLIWYGMRYISSRTCIRFRYWSNEKDYLYFTWPGLGQGCKSLNGRRGGIQNVTLKWDVCPNNIPFIINLSYTVGLNREHRRRDRDTFITVNFENLNEVKIKSFEKYSLEDDTFGEMGLVYDYESLFHASRRSGSKNSQDTVIPYHGHIPIGQWTELSRMDIFKINLLYCYKLSSFYICLFNGIDKSSKLCLTNNAMESTHICSILSKSYKVGLETERRNDGQKWTVNTENGMSSGTTIVARGSAEITQKRSNKQEHQPYVMSISGSEQEETKELLLTVFKF